MIAYFGQTTCPHCEKQNRFVTEQTHPTQAEGDHEFVMIGDASPLSKVPVEKMDCEFCFQSFKVHTVVRQNVLHAFLNETEYKTLQQEKKPMKDVQKGDGLKQEHAFSEYIRKSEFSLPFKEQPFHVNHTLQLQDNTWTVKSVHKKEHIELEWERRMENDFVDAFYYEMENEKGERKWLWVKDDGDENAVFSINMPVVREYEKLYDITEYPTSSKVVFEKKLGKEYKLRAIQHITGTQMLILDANENIQADLLGDGIEELIEQVEELLHHQTQS